MYCAEIRSPEWLRCLAVVFVHEAAQDVAPPHSAGGPRLTQGHWASLAEPLVGSRLVVVGDIHIQHAPQVALTDDQQVVEALGSLFWLLSLSSPCC